MMKWNCKPCIRLSLGIPRGGFVKKEKGEVERMEGYKGREFFLDGLVFFLVQNSSHLKTKKLYWRRSLEGFWVVRASFSNSIYIVIILLKLKNIVT